MSLASMDASKGMSMKRRQILTLSALALALPYRSLFAQAHHGMQHRNMDMSGHHSGSNSGLLALGALPHGERLRPLEKLQNESTQAGRFTARLSAQTQGIKLAKPYVSQMYTYNGNAPGPLIEVYEGDTVDILFYNQLPEATTVHWHGLPVPPDQDGNPQDPVAPGEQRHYRFTLPEGSAGTYWYHPHPHGQTAMQVARGLAGTLIVHSRTDPLAEMPEQHWMISDLRLDEQAQIPPNTMLDWMNGREGQFILINGQYQPSTSLAPNTRLRIWNSCSARYLRLQVDGCQWVLLGTDGGLLESARPPSDELLLVPGQRVEALLISEQDRATTLRALYYDRHKMMVEERPQDYVLAHVQVPKQGNNFVPARLRDTIHLGQPTAKKKVTFSEMDMSHDDHDMSMSMLQSMFMINGKVYNMDRIDLQSKLGEVELWQVFNDSHMDHPFHLHGTQFIVTEREQAGQRLTEPYPAWRDTINLQPYETVYFLVKQDQPGIRMFHCHILEHEDLGMMANLLVS